MHLWREWLIKPGGLVVMMTIWNILLCPSKCAFRPLFVSQWFKAATCICFITRLEWLTKGTHNRTFEWVIFELHVLVWKRCLLMNSWYENVFLLAVAWNLIEWRVLHQMSFSNKRKDCKKIAYWQPSLIRTISGRSLSSNAQENDFFVPDGNRIPILLTSVERSNRWATGTGNQVTS